MNPVKLLLLYMGLAILLCYAADVSFWAGLFLFILGNGSGFCLETLFACWRDSENADDNHISFDHR